MSSRIAVIGSTGLIGRHFLERIGPDDYAAVTAITRRPIKELEGHSHIMQAIHDFSDLELMRKDLQVDTLICSLGTTIKTAGSQEVFFQVDHDLPLAIARVALEAGCQRMILISSVGANANSSVFYSRVKGQLENDLATLGFKHLFVLRPSMLLGEREEHRPAEHIAKILMPPLSFLVPWKYKPIHATRVAAAIHRAILSEEEGVQIWEGQPLFKPI